MFVLRGHGIWPRFCKEIKKRNILSFCPYLVSVIDFIDGVIIAPPPDNQNTNQEIWLLYKRQRNKKLKNSATYLQRVVLTDILK